MNAGSYIKQNFIYFALIPAIGATLLIYRIRGKILLLFFVIILGTAVYNFRLIPYFMHRHSITKLYEQEYRHPLETVQIGTKKRNIILIYLESFEQNYLDDNLFSPLPAPQLQKLSRRHTSINGFRQLYGTNYTISALVASLCGVPFYSQYEGLGQTENFLPNLVCVPQILRQNGYNTFLMKGASLKFSATDVFARQHGFEQTAGKEEIMAQPEYNLPGNSWGISDRGSFLYAREAVTRLQRERKPFLLAMVTLDMHSPDIFLDPQCAAAFGDDRDTVKCVDGLTGQFVTWLQQQDFYADTTVIIIGDHLQPGHNGLYPREVNQRSVLNIFINPVMPPPSLNRAWTTVDLAPTILEAAGIDAPAFGLGRSLWRPQKTLWEKFGGLFNIEVQKYSRFYQRFYQPETAPARFVPVKAGRFYQGGQLAAMGSPSQTIFNKVYLRRLAINVGEQKPLVLEMDAQVLLNGKAAGKQIEVLINGQTAESWTISAEEANSFRRRITLPPQGGNVLVEFKDNQNPDALPLGIIRLRALRN